MPADTVPNDLPALHEAVTGWYAGAARDLPWRRPDATPWAVLVSEVMLQQTPVSRVAPAYRRWLERWPAPAALAAEPVGEAVREWGRLGYPRRALRLHAAATSIVERYAGELPRDLAALRALPGVGDYTAAAVAVFAFGQRHAVLDTNVRRVLARLFRGVADSGPSVTAAERRLAEQVLPAEEATAARWSAAVMELGALRCRAGAPLCSACPVAARCAWRTAGTPRLAGPSRRPQPYAGTDRHARGTLLAVLREADGPVDETALATAWPDPEQRARALASLLADGLLRRRDERYELPGVSGSADRLSEMRSASAATQPTATSSQNETPR